MSQPFQPTTAATWQYQTSEAPQYSPAQTSPSFDFTFTSLFPFDSNNSFSNSQLPSSPTDSESSSSFYGGESFPAEDPSFQFVTPTEILFNPYLDQDVDWMTLSFPSSPNSLSSPVQFRFPDVPQTLPSRQPSKNLLESSRPSASPPSAKRQRTRAASSPVKPMTSVPKPCPCRYCVPSKPGPTLVSSTSTRPRPPPLQTTPAPNTYVKIDLPQPKIVGSPIQELPSTPIRSSMPAYPQTPVTTELPSNEPESDAVTVFKQQQAAIEQARRMMQQSPFAAAVRSRSATVIERGMDGFDGRPFFGDARTYL
ncbi:hypothetical protein BJ508DRAFT_313999 [Ascobolus immersus RN42]|uniref:Uncharacterized protein n=1 Tax=Ascobolus immersus RN42 TaxID=1160509 RepID=A0A3N4HGL3_ASCIM|nr:hypothetical protein BJ508DRAFT_313999 [Ascobolus immersus RN42]